MTRNESNQEKTVDSTFAPTPTAGWKTTILILCVAYAVFEGIHSRVVACTGSPCAANLSFAKETTRILLAVPTPTHISAPIRAGTLIVV
jgi:hypothetical protein